MCKTLGGPKLHLSCSHSGCREDLSLRSGSQGAKILHCARQNHWPTKAERATFEQVSVRISAGGPYLIESSDQGEGEGRDEGVGVGRELRERRFIQSLAVGLSKACVNCICEFHDLVWCLLQGRDDHEKVRGTQDTGSELLWPGKSLLPVVKKVGLASSVYVTEYTEHLGV